jgi:hypothetical protein
MPHNIQAIKAEGSLRKIDMNAVAVIAFAVMWGLMLLVGIIVSLGQDLGWWVQ